MSPGLTQTEFYDFILEMRKLTLGETGPGPRAGH